MTRRRGPSGLSVHKGTHKLSTSPEDGVMRVNPTASSKWEPRPSEQPVVCFVWGDVENLNIGFFEEIYSKIWIIALKMIFRTQDN